MSFEPCQNCGKPAATRGLCASCSAAVNDENEAVTLTEAICAAVVPRVRARRILAPPLIRVNSRNSRNSRKGISS